MHDEKYEKDKLKEKYTTFAETAEGGIFTRKTRKRLLGIKGIAGRNKTMRDFWHDRRKNVRNALEDLAIFIEVGGDNVNQVVTQESLKPVVHSLLLRPVWRNAKPDLVRAEIARLFIHTGFQYLLQMRKKFITKSSENTIELALDLSRYLADSFRASSERRYISPLERPK